MRATSNTLSLVLLAALLAATPAMAATITVDNVTCTLADAITAANTDTATGGCPAGDPGLDTIVLTGDVILLDRLPAVTTDITVQGNDYTVSRDPGEEPFRIFEVVGASDLILDSVTVTGGIDFIGGGIWAVYGAELGLINSTVSGNVSGLGGGIAVFDAYLYSSYSEVTDNSVPYSDGFLYGTGGGIASSYDSGAILLATEVSGNDAAFAGGGIANGLDSLTLMLGSTVSGNTAILGGGTVNFESAAMVNYLSTVKDNTAYLAGGTANAANGYQAASYSEFSGNTAYYAGGLLNVAAAELQLVNVTVSGNAATADTGGGLLNIDSVAFLKNTTFSGNAAAEGFYGAAVYNADGAVYAEGSLFGNSTGSNCAGDPIVDVGGNLADDASCGTVPATLTGLDPVLADNGAFFPYPTVDTPRTHALLPFSNAIDAAGTCGLDFDQRFAPRNDGFCDSGAYEAPELTEEEVIALFADLIANAGLPAGLESSLLSKLDAALASLERGNETAAINQLGALINAIEAQAGKKISEEDAAAFIQLTELIIASIEGA